MASVTSATSAADLGQLLKMMQSKSTDMAQKLIKMDAQVAVQAQDISTKETIIDMYA